MTTFRHIVTYAYIACWALFGGSTHAAEKPDAPAAQAPVGKAGSLPTLVPDPTLRVAIQKALEQNHQGHLLRDTRDKTLAQAFLQVDHPPADMAFDVSLRSGERMWRVGPMAWKKGEMKGWAYNVDLPATLTHVDIIFTPSARAGMLMSRFPLYPIKGLTTIWSGEPIVVADALIHIQDISMVTPRRPPGIEESIEHLIDAISPDSDQARQLADGMTLDKMQQLLDEQAATPDSAPEALFTLGCVQTAQGKLDEAMLTLLKVRGVASLEDRLQHELRYICARWLHAANNGSVPEMFSLARAYEEGNGVGSDVQQAKYWYRKAANAGHAEASARLAAMRPPAPSAVDPAAKELAEYRAQAAKWHEKPTTTYQEWVRRHTRKTLQARDAAGKTDDLKVVITIVGGETEGTSADDIRSSQTRNETELFADGVRRNFFFHSRGVSGGGSDKPLPADRLARIDQLLARLPDDHGELPPVNRRLLIDAADPLERHVRVYDLADAPPDIYELMRLLNTGTAYVPSFRSYNMIHVGGTVNDGTLAVSPQNELLYSAPRGRLQWWDPASHEFIAETYMAEVTNIVFSPDKVHALVHTSNATALIDLPGRNAVRTFKDRYRGQFSQDGKRVLLFARKAPMQILDTKSWEPAEHADDVPEDCTNFIPAPTTHRALVRTEDGNITLWDTAAHRPVKLLCSDSAVTMTAAFSPDESQFALCACPFRINGDGGGTPIVIFKSDTGKLVHELCPFASGWRRERIQSLLWTPDGAYVLATPGSSAGNSGISVFNAANGRHRGELIGPTSINGMGLLTRSGELVAGDQYGRIWFWNLSIVMDHVREFEASLTAAGSR